MRPGIRTGGTTCMRIPVAQRADQQNPAVLSSTQLQSVKSSGQGVVGDKQEFGINIHTLLYIR